MQVEAIYENGHLRFDPPLNLKHHQFRLVVSIPDDEIIESAQPEQPELSPAQRYLDTIKNILGKSYYPRPSASVAEDKEAYASALLEKYGK